MGIGVLEALLLRITGPPPTHLHVLADLASPMAEPLEGMLAALALAAEALAAYLVLALALRTLTHLPGFAGQVANTAERTLTVPAVRRGLDGLLGAALVAQLALAPASTGTGIGTVQALPRAATAVASTEDSPRMGRPPRTAPQSKAANASAAEIAASSIPLPIWLSADPALGRGPSPARPRDLAPHQGSLDASQTATPVPPAAGTGGPPRQGTAEGPDPQRTGPAATHHTIEPGDTLWSIAAGQLPIAARTEANIAGYWRQIYGANRGAIGSDPDRIHPGTALSVPPYPTSQTPPPSSGSAPATGPEWPRPGGLAGDLPDPLP
jgi:LysM repeat protein